MALVSIGGVALAIWVGVVLTVPPQRLLTYLAFFIPLFVFCSSMMAACLYWLTTRAEQPRPRALGNSVRVGGLFSGVLILNLAFVVGRKWSIVVLVIGVALAGLAELLGRLRSR